MEEIYLIKPTITDKEDVLAYRQEFFDEQDYIVNGGGGLHEAKSYEEWLTHNEIMEHKDGVPEGLVCASTYLLRRTSDKRLLGTVNIRHELNDYLINFGGHIGYSIRKSERRKGYAKELVRRSLAICDELGIKQVLITCANTNVASRNTILANHGVMENEVVHEGEVIQRFWIAL